MTGIKITKADVAEGFFDGAVARILELQRPSGAIPWYDNGVLDPWNHTESAMGLTVLGKTDEARAAYQFLKDHQLEDGSWWSQYGAAVPMDDHQYTGNEADEKHVKDTNMCAYIATGVRHFHRATGDAAFLETYWPVVKRAIDYVLTHQTEHGDIRWTAPSPQTPENDALITGCSSIYKSLECAIALAYEVGEPQPAWVKARALLGEALRDKPHRFDRTWEPKSNYSMDWYYPVLTGAVTGDAAHARVDAKWNVFVTDLKGCRCVIDQPWVTIAESCELALALIRIGRREQAEALFAWQHQWRDETGAYWMGHQYAENVPWPVEKPAWTAAAVILAADALLGLSPAHDLFTRAWVNEDGTLIHAP